MAHAQKPDFVFRRNGRVYLNRQGASVQSTTGSRVVRISGSNAGYIMFRGSVKSTGYPLHSPVSPSLSLSCVTVCHHISTALYIVYDIYKLQHVSAPKCLPQGVIITKECTQTCQYMCCFSVEEWLKPKNAKMHRIDNYKQQYYDIKLYAM